MPRPSQPTESLMNDREDLFIFPSFTLSGIIFAESLPPGEMKTGRWLHDDLAAELRHKRLRNEYRELGNTRDFRKLMKELRRRSACGERLVLHLDIHGLDDRSGVRFEPSGEELAWDAFAEECRRLNTYMENNLVVVMAACHGFYAAEPVKAWFKLAPFFALVGPSERVPAGLLRERFPVFYRKLLFEEDIVEAREILSPEFEMFIAEELFVFGFAFYFLEYCSGRGRKTRIEQLLSEQMARVPTTNLKAARKLIKRETRATEREFLEYRRTFLIGGVPSNEPRFQATFERLVTWLLTNRSQL